MRLTLLLLLLLSNPVAGAQQAGSTKPARTSPWFSAQTIDFVALTPAPPAPHSKRDRQDMKDVLLAQRTRTAAQVGQAKMDDGEEDIFVFASILGPRFNAAEMPRTAELSQHLRNASAVINPALKLNFGRPRPFVASTRIHPVCPVTSSSSFPSGHSMVGTLEALALTQIVPERAPEILLRLDQYMHNRVVCGVHYPSDVAASRIVASSLYGLIAASPAFQTELATARAEVRSHLRLADSSAASAQAENDLASNTVLIVRHAEKPLGSPGGTGLTEIGQHRAEAYARYFRPFREAGAPLEISALFAGADSASSVRPRLTLEPLSRASGLPLDATIRTKDAPALVRYLRSHPHGDTPLICWRHGQIPALLRAFGVAPSALLPDGKWPDDVFDWVLLLRFDAQGRVLSQERIRERFDDKLD